MQVSEGQRQARGSLTASKQRWERASERAGAVGVCGFGAKPFNTNFSFLALGLVRIGAPAFSPAITSKSSAAGA